MAEAKSKGSGDLGKCPKCSQVAEMIRQRGIGHCFQEEPVPILRRQSVAATPGSWRKRHNIRSVTSCSVWPVAPSVA